MLFEIMVQWFWQVYRLTCSTRVLCHISACPLSSHMSNLKTLRLTNSSVSTATSYIVIFLSHLSAFLYSCGHLFEHSLSSFYYWCLTFFLLFIHLPIFVFLYPMYMKMYNFLFTCIFRHSAVCLLFCLYIFLSISQSRQLSISVSICIYFPTH
jgi:hypothetical protein